jgi:hypothetical protein
MEVPSFIMGRWYQELQDASEKKKLEREMSFGLKLKNNIDILSTKTMAISRIVS